MCSSDLIGFVAVAPPAYGLSVTVIDKGSGAPIEEAVVRWGAFRAATDAEGRASLRLPPGSEDLIVWKAGFAIPVAPLAIESDRELVIEAVLVPEENPDDFWKM